MTGFLRRRAATLASFALLGLAACGGGERGGSTPTPAPSPTPTPTPSANPCASVSQEPGGARSAVAGALGKRSGVYGDTGWSTLDARWSHDVATRRMRARPRTPGVSGIRDRDAGDITVIEDNGQVIGPANAFDLRGRGLRFRPNAAGGYDVATIDATFRSELGSRLSLQDDDSVGASVPFAFPLFGRSVTDAFVNSDGNITFGEGDAASTARNVTRFLSGAPRIALFFADLDPSAGGSVWVHAAGDAYTVTWCSVRGFESARSATAQVALLPDGTVELKYADSTSLVDAVVGVSPGETATFVAADLTATAQSSGRAGIGERFSANADLDLVAAAERFYAAHGDAFDQLIFWSDERVVTDAFAFEITVRNDIRGLGLNQFNDSHTYGSQGRLSSVVLMDTLSKYPADPQQRFLGENNAVSVLGQEVGHRWLVFLRFRDVDRQVSSALLGRDDAHWGFFVDSDASVMEGNDIEDLGGGSFRTVGAVSRFSRLDQYAMGLLGAADVPPTFYVESPTNVRPAAENDSAPRVGVTFNGTRRDVRIDDVIDAVGPRVPSVADAPKVWRQAFIYVVGGGRTANDAQIEKLDRIRLAWEPFYADAVSGRGRVETRLR